MVTLDTEYQILFQKGIEVEVTSDEEGFKGAWYRATVLESVPKSASKKRKKALVEYKSLVTEDGSGPLTEYIDPSYIRPLPPQVESSNDVFEVYDVVDAFYRDGWWTGTVRKILEDGKLRVYFDNPPDLLEFEGKDLRAHWDWVEGNWVRPGKQQSTGSTFSSGTEVEVNADNQENCRDIWYPAIVIKENVDGTFLVKYQNLRNGDEAGAVRITVDSQQIRPTPPCYLDRNYELLEKVDTFDGIGWRAGVITKVLSGRRYNVFFKHGNEDKELSHSDIRPHVEWSNGNWVSKSKEVLIAPDNQEELGLARDATGNTEMAPKLESSGSAKVITNDAKPRLTNIRKNLMEMSTPGPEDSASYPLPPNKRKMRLPNSYNSGMHSSTNKKLRDNSLPVTAVQLKKIPNEKPEETRSSLATPKTERKGMKFSSKPAESIVLGKRIRTSHQKFGVDFQTVDLKRKGRPTKLEIKRPPSVKGKESNARVAAAEELNENNIKEKVAETSVIVGLKATEVGGSQAGSSSLTSNEESLKLIRVQSKNLNDSERDNSMQPKGGGSSQRRKRGRPRKLVIISSKAPDDGKEHKEAAGAADEIVVKDRITNEAEIHELEGVASTVVREASGDRTAEVPKTNCVTKEVDMAIAVTSNMADDDRPLSTWKIGGMHLSSGEELRLSSTNTVNGFNEERKSQNDIVMVSSMTGTEGGSTPVKNQMLPFLKKSPIWKTIESMEVFQIVPQKPHFLPLSETKEEYREGSAIGIMVTFAGLFEKISLLKYDDSRSTFTSTLDSLLDLEKHGFDVTLLRRRVNELLTIRDRQGELLDDLKDAEREISQHTDEKTKLDEEMEAIKKKIIMLQEQLESKKSKKEKKSHEIIKLQSRAGAISGRLRGTRLDFEKLAAAAWKL